MTGRKVASTARGQVDEIRSRPHTARDVFNADADEQAHKVMPHGGLDKEHEACENLKGATQHQVENKRPPGEKKAAQKTAEDSGGDPKGFGDVGNLDLAKADFQKKRYGHGVENRIPDLVGKDK